MRFPVLLLLVASAPGVRAEDPPRFILERADGAPVAGTLERVSDDWSIRLGGTTPSETRGANLIALRRERLRLPPRPIGPALVFANGDQVPVKSMVLAGERVRATLGDGQEIDVPVATLCGFWLAPAETEEAAERLRRRWTGGRRVRDQVMLRSGDVIDGTLVGLDDKALQLEVRSKEVKVERTRVAAVALNTALIRFPLPRGPYGHLVLADGSRVALASARCDDGRTLVGKALFGAPIRAALEQVRALDLRQGRAVFLSDLPPRAYEHTPYLDLAWPWVADGSTAGLDLRLGGGTYDKGMGLHSQSRLAYDLAGRYRRFHALVGFDDRAESRDGEVRVRVLVDGKAMDLGWDGVMRPGAAPRPIRLDVTDARELLLAVEFGRRGSVNGRIDWADARLVK
jgi:hypothetical protein